MFINLVTLDGPCGAGKSTIAKLLANKLSFKHLDTGAMYRAVTLYFINNKIDIKDNNKVLNALNSINIKFNNNKIYLDNIEVTNAIRETDVISLVSQVSAISIVRKNMVSLQRKIASDGNYVIDGRDIGSVVFPNAKYKFYIDASLDKRVKRRYNEEISNGKSITFEEVRHSIKYRDEYDSKREDSPLVIPDNATIIDSTNMTIDEVVGKIISVISNIKAL